MLAWKDFWNFSLKVYFNHYLEWRVGVQVWFKKWKRIKNDSVIGLFEIIFNMLN